MKARKMRFEDISGKRFGRLTVVKFVEVADCHRNSKWLVRCDCGTEFICYRSNLVNGHTQSCGCLKRTKSRTAWDRHKRNNVKDEK